MNSGKSGGFFSAEMKEKLWIITRVNGKTYCIQNQETDIRIYPIDADEPIIKSIDDGGDEVMSSFNVGDYVIISSSTIYRKNGDFYQLTDDMKNNEWKVTKILENGWCTITDEKE